MSSFKNLFIGLLSMGCLLTSAQQTTVTAGGNASSARGSVSYTVGQTLYSTTVSATGSAALGVQQPYELFVVSGIDDAKGIDIAIKTYPNPVTDYLIVKVQETTLRNLNYQLVDVSGNVLVSNKIQSNEVKLRMNQFAPGAYILHIYSEKREIKVFKVIKS